MHRSSVRVWIVIAGLAVAGAGARVVADSGRPDFGAFVQSLLRDQSEALFGIGRPLDHRAHSTARASTRLTLRRA